MRSKVLLVVKNPLFIVPPLVVVLGFGWQQYTYAGRDLNLPSPASNLMPNSDFAQFAVSGIPVGWQVARNGSASYQTASGKGYASGNSFKVAVSGYQNGDIAVTSPKVAVQSGKTYLFKGYYTAGTDFALLARYYHADGSSKLNLVQTYPGASGTWSTVSDAFKAGPDVTAVQFAYRIYSDGNLELNSLYLEPQDDVYIAPTLTGDNVVPNGKLAAGSYDAPDTWSTYHAGTNTTSFSYDQDPGGSYVQTTVSDFKDGQAKWQYPPQPVQPGQYYQLSVDYRSDVSVPLVAEYVMQDGQRQDQVVATAAPADDWTTMTHRFDIPPQAKTMFLSLPLQRDGTVASRDYALTNITKPGATPWQQPLASITFDDGWQLSYENAVPVLQQYGYDATFYINPSVIETPDFMTAAELNTLSKDGNEIGAHGYDHDDMTAINPGALDYQLRQGRNYLRTAGFPVTDFATPYGRSDAEVQWSARHYYTTLRSTDTGINTSQNLDPYSLKVVYISDNTDPQVLSDALKTAKAENGWVIFVYHRIASRADLPYGYPKIESSTTTTAAFKKQMSIVHGSGIKVLPVAAAYDTLQHQ